MNFSFKTFLEAIKVPPHLPGKWWEDTLTKAIEIESQIFDKYDLIKKYNELADEIGFEDIENIYYNLPGNFRRMINKNEYSSLSKLSELMKEYSDAAEAKNLSQNIVKSARNRLDMIGNYDLNFSKFINLWKYYVRDSAEDKAVSDYDHALEMSEDNQIVIDVKKFFEAILNYIKILKNVKKYVDVIKEREEIAYSKYGWTEKPKLAPKHKDKEILYHATPFVNEILQHGFKTKEEIGREMLGGDTQGGISFTADFRIAKAISVALKDVINIANGNINIGYIIKLAKSEGIDVKEFKDWIIDMKSRSQKLQMISGKKENPWGRDLTYNDRFDDLKEKAFDLYRRYLSTTKVRYDPVFFGVDAKNFQGLNPDNVGVLACKIDMSTNIRYLSSMEEFRIPINGILKIIKVFKD